MSLSWTCEFILFFRIVNCMLVVHALRILLRVANKRFMTLSIFLFSRGMRNLYIMVYFNLFTDSKTIRLSWCLMLLSNKVNYLNRTLKVTTLTIIQWLLQIDIYLICKYDAKYY